MATNKYANHPNNVMIREWSNENRGRSSGLSTLMFPDYKVPQVVIGCYRNGEQLFDDEMVERAKPFMAQIELEEKQGKRKVYKGKLAGPSLSTSDRFKRYDRLEETEEYLDYVEWFEKYSGHSEVFLEKLKLALPNVPSGSNLLSRDFRSKYFKAKQYVIDKNLPVVPPLSPVRESEFRDAKRLHMLREATKNLGKVEFKNTIDSLDPKYEFQDQINHVQGDKRLSLLVPMILLANFRPDEDMETANDLYKTFTNTNLPVSVVKITNMRNAIKRAYEMIEECWFEDGVDQYDDENTVYNGSQPNQLDTCVEV